eukprot:1137065-Pelagomonas_calceolata.AAC.1
MKIRGSWRVVGLDDTDRREGIAHALVGCTKELVAATVKARDSLCTGQYKSTGLKTWQYRVDTWWFGKVKCMPQLVVAGEQGSGQAQDWTHGSSGLTHDGIEGGMLCGTGTPAQMLTTSAHTLCWLGRREHVYQQSSASNAGPFNQTPHAYSLTPCSPKIPT